MKQIPWIIIIPVVIVLILIVVVYLLSRPDDVSCPDGMYFNSNCDGGKCTWYCPTGKGKTYTNSQCDCVCGAPSQALIDNNNDGEFVPDNSDGTCTSIKADNPDANPADQIKNCRCTDRFCTDVEQQQHKAYNPDSDECTKCKVNGQYTDPCKQEYVDQKNPEYEYCCANGMDCNLDNSCFPPYKIFLEKDGEDYNEKVCDENTGVAVKNGEPTTSCFKEDPDKCCVGTQAECCRQICGVDGQTGEHNLCSDPGSTCVIVETQEDDENETPLVDQCKTSQYCNKWVSETCYDREYLIAKNCTKCDDESYQYAACVQAANIIDIPPGGEKCQDGMCITRLIDYLNKKNKDPNNNKTCTGDEAEPDPDADYQCVECPS